MGHSQLVRTLAKKKAERGPIFHANHFRGGDFSMDKEAIRPMSVVESLQGEKETETVSEHLVHAYEK